MHGLTPHAHHLVATATHPSGWVAPSATSNFNVSSQAETVTNAYDEMGNVISRTWSGGKVQTLTWDARGRLIKVVQTGVSPFTWTALYDGLDRRQRTIYAPEGGTPVTVNATFDPEAEFLEIGTQINGLQHWKVYGPDITETYGGADGLGGLEATIDNDGVVRGIVSDFHGNCSGYIAGVGASVTWAPAQYTAWGPVPGWSSGIIDGTKPLHELIGYRGLCLDPPGIIQMGERAYDPDSGRWLSPDPMGHGGSLSLYDYCDNDPLNVHDMDGRMGKTVSQPSIFSWAGIQRQEQMYSVLNKPSYTTGAAFSPPKSELSEISELLNYIPVIGTIKQGLEVATGYDLVAGRHLSDSERVSAGVGAVLGALPMAAPARAASPIVSNTLRTASRQTIVRGPSLIAAKLPSLTNVKGICFVAGTLVKTEQGEKAIENIQVGDKVWATNPETKKSGYRKVIKTFVNQTKQLETVTTTAEDKLVCTPEHPFWTEERGWVEAGDLKLGETLLAANGSDIKVSAIEHQKQSTEVYNFEVEGFHTYYVGSNPVLVHNTCAAESTQFVYRGLAKGEDSLLGLTARTPGAGNSPISHVAGKIQSQWISTTKSLDTAVAKYGQNGVVRIDLSKVKSNILDVSGGFSKGGRMSNWAIRDWPDPEKVDG